MTAPTRPLAIEMVVPALVLGGMEMMTVNLARALARRGHRVGITCLQEKGELAKELEGSDIQISVIPCPGSVPLLRAHQGLRNHFALRAPDVVHAHNGVWAKAALAARAARVPAVIHTAHGFDLKEPWFSDPLRWWAGLHTDLVVAVSHPLQQYFIRKIRLPAGRVTTVINGIDTARFAPGAGRGSLRASLGIDPHAPLIGCIARLDPVKNHALLIQAMAVLVRTNPDIRLVLVGDGPLREPIQDQVQSLGLEEHVILAGTIADTAAVYREFDIFALPSFFEGTSISILEAMASGTPVVATEVGGTPWLLQDGACGRLVPSGDAAAFADAIAQLLDDEGERVRIAAAARARVTAEFDHAAMVRTYERLYGQVVAGSLTRELKEG